MKEKLSFSTYTTIGVMLFALFFGAGNLIFPAQLGQNAGTNLWQAVIGFLITNPRTPGPLSGPSPWIFLVSDTFTINFPYQSCLAVSTQS